MAAIDPSESPKRPKSPAEEVETSGQKNEAVESGCILNNDDETPTNKTTESPEDEQGANVGIDGGRIASHSEVSVESGAGTDKTTCNSPGDLTSAEKMSEAPGSDQRAFEWSETEDNEEEAKTHKQENDECGMLTLLMYFTVSFSLGANLSYSFLYVTDSVHTVNSANANYHNKIKLAFCTADCGP